MSSDDPLPVTGRNRATRADGTAGPSPLHPVDRAAELAAMPVADAIGQLASMARARRADVFGYLPLAMQAQLVRDLPRQDLAEVMADLDPDDRADLFNHVAAGDRQRLIADLPPQARAELQRLSAYPPGSVGAIMTTNYATLVGEMTATEAISALRQQAPGRETIYRPYVLDAEGRLVGSVMLHDLILKTDDALVRDIMHPTPDTVTTGTDQEDAARMIAHYDVLSLPVTDAQGRLVGVVTHDDATDAMQEETTEDFQKIATVLPFTQSLRAAGIGVLYSRRIVWLALLIFGNLFSGAGIAYFEETILSYVALVFFLPLLIDSSGNTGSQSATLMVRALATGDVKMADWRALIVREAFVAAALGLTMAVVVMPIGYFRGGSEIAIVVGITMFIVVMLGSMVGMSLPFVLSRLRLDPATASGPLVTTISDAFGVLVYFSIATKLLQI